MSRLVLEFQFPPGKSFTCGLDAGHPPVLAYSILQQEPGHSLAAVHLGGNHKQVQGT